VQTKCLSEQPGTLSKPELEKSTQIKTRYPRHMTLPGTFGRSSRRDLLRIPAGLRLGTCPDAAPVRDGTGCSEEAKVIVMTFWRISRDQETFCTPKGRRISLTCSTTAPQSRFFTQR